MLSFKAEDGYSYMIKVKGRHEKTYRIDSEELNIALGTNETLEVIRLDISKEISKGLRDIRNFCE